MDQQAMLSIFLCSKYQILLIKNFDIFTRIYDTIENNTF